ncbi:MAG: hypothetical protein QGM50_02580 [Anaerolineae bacterium]|nr:hypothetical protein [Anaerolineae bacterium]
MNLGINSTAAIAKKLNRHWIGFEQDEKYVRVAQNRIDAIQAATYDEALFA